MLSVFSIFFFSGKLSLRTTFGTASLSTEYDYFETEKAWANLSELIFPLTEAESKTPSVTPQSLMFFYESSYTPRWLKVRSSSAISKSLHMLSLSSFTFVPAATSYSKGLLSMINLTLTSLPSASLPYIAAYLSTTWMIEFGTIPISSILSVWSSDKRLPRK